MQLYVCGALNVMCKTLLPCTYYVPAIKAVQCDTDHPPHDAHPPPPGAHHDQRPTSAENISHSQPSPNPGKHIM